MSNVFPGVRVLCRAANNGRGLRILLYEAQKERKRSQVCDNCKVRAQCDALYSELNPQHHRYRAR